MPESLRSLQGRRNAHLSWAKTLDRSARTANARRAFEDKFLIEAGGDPKRAESLRRAFFADLVVKSVQSRKRRREAEEQARREHIAALLRVGGDS